MSNNQTELLLEEYKSLRSLHDQHNLTAYRTLPLLGAVVAAAVALGARDIALISLLILGSTTAIVIWLCIVQSIVCGIGLHLVELECKINSLTKADDLVRLSWQSKQVASLTSNLFPNIKTYTIISFIIVMISTIYTTIQVWIYGDVATRALASLFFCSSVLCLYCLTTTETQTKNAKSQLINQYGTIDC